MAIRTLAKETVGGARLRPAVVDEAKGIPDIPETRSYVDAILRVLVKKADAGAPPP